MMSLNKSWQRFFCITLITLNLQVTYFLSPSACLLCQQPCRSCYDSRPTHTSRPASRNDAGNWESDLTVGLQRSILQAKDALEIMDIVSSSLAWFDVIHSTTCLFRLGNFAQEDIRRLPSSTFENPAFEDLLDFQFRHIAETKGTKFISGKKGEQALANTALAVGMLSKSTGKVEMLVSPLAKLSLKRIPGMRDITSIRAATNILFGFVLARCRSPEVDQLFDLTSGELVRIFRATTRQLTEQELADLAIEISTLAWSFATYGSVDERTMAELATWGNKCAHKLGSWGVCAMLWSFKQLNHANKCPALMTGLKLRYEGLGLNSGDIERSKLGPSAWVR